MNAKEKEAQKREQEIQKLEKLLNMVRPVDSTKDKKWAIGLAEWPWIVMNLRLRRL